MIHETTSEERITGIKQRCSAFTPEKWELRVEKPRMFQGGHSGYFKYVNGEQVYRTAYHIRGLETLGNYECGAMEKPAAEFVLHAKDDIHWLLSELETAKQRIADLSSMNETDMSINKRLSEENTLLKQQLGAKRGRVIQERLDALGEVIDLLNDSDGSVSFVLQRVSAKRQAALTVLQAWWTKKEE